MKSSSSVQGSGQVLRTISCSSEKVDRQDGMHQLSSERIFIGPSTQQPIPMNNQATLATYSPPGQARASTLMRSSKDLFTSGCLFSQRLLSFYYLSSTINKPSIVTDITNSYRTVILLDCRKLS